MRWARCSTSSTVSPRSRIARKRLEDDVDDRRRETERRLVEQQQVGAATSARAIASCCCWPPERRPPGVARTPARSGTARSTAAMSSRRTRLRSPAGEAEPQVLLDGELGEDPPSLRDERDTGLRDPLRRTAPQRSSRRAGFLRAGRDQPHDRVQRRRLAGTVRPDQADDLAAAHLEREVADGCHAAVGDVEPFSSSIAGSALTRLPRARRSRRGTPQRRRDCRGSLPACPRRACVPGRGRGSGRRRP